jgi:hypothetical protein
VKEFIPELFPFLIETAHLLKDDLMKVHNDKNVEIIKFSSSIKLKEANFY